MIDSPEIDFPFRTRMIRGVTWNVVAGICERGLALTLSILVARLLGKEGYGRYGIVIATVMMFSQLAAGGLGSTAARFVAELRVMDPHRLRGILTLTRWVALGAGFVLTLIVFSYADLLAMKSLADPSLASAIRWAALCILPVQFIAIDSGILQGAEQFRSIGVGRVIAGALRIAGCVLGYIAADSLGIIVAYSASLILEAAVLYVLARKATGGIGFARDGMRKAWKENWVLFEVALPSALTFQVAAPIMWIAQSLLAGQPGGFESLAVYAVGTQWRTLVGFLPGRANEVAMPVMTNLVSAGDHLRFSKLFRRALLATIAWSIAASIVLSAAGPFILRTYGPGFPDAWRVFGLLVSVGILQSIGDFLTSTLISLNRMWWRLGTMVGWGIGMIIAAYFLVPAAGVLGLAFAEIVARLVQICIGIGPNLKGATSLQSGTSK